MKLHKQPKLRFSHKIFFILFVSTNLISCNQDVLDIKPATNISEIDIFSNETLLENYVNGRYYSFPYYDFGSTNTDPLSDDVIAPGNADATSYNRGITTPSTAIPVNRWAFDYSNLRKVDFFFSKIDNAESSVSEKLKTRLKGEMHFIRAWLYADLINLYGDVVLLKELSKITQENFNKEKTPYQDVVSFIVAELDSAISELPNIAFKSGGGRISKGAALALKSRVLLYASSPLHNKGSYDKGKLEQARDAAQAVINLGTYSIEEKYSKIFDAPEYSKEIIFARAANSTHMPFNLFGVTAPDRYYLPFVYNDVDLRYFQPLQSLVDAYEMKNGKMITDNTSGYDPQNPYLNRDSRFYETVIHHGSVLKGLSGVTDKYNNADETVTIRYDKDKSGDDTKNGNSYNTALNSSYNVLKRASPGLPMRGVRNVYKPWIYLRLADMYLIIAEAEAELGNDVASMTAINVVRKRASMPIVSGLSGTSLRERYRNERRVEFAFEDLRWYDIRRWMIAPQVLNKSAKGIAIVRDNSLKPTVDRYNYDSNVLDANRTWINKMYYLPIPFSEIQVNKLLKQNAGY